MITDISTGPYTYRGNQYDTIEQAEDARTRDWSSCHRQPILDRWGFTIRVGW